MKYRTRVYHLAERRADIWGRWQRGESMISPTGGIRPPDRIRGKFALRLWGRKEISRWLSMKQSLRMIARRLQIRRHGTVLCALSYTDRRAAVLLGGCDFYSSSLWRPFYVEG